MASPFLPLLSPPSSLHPLTVCFLVWSGLVLVLSLVCAMRALLPPMSDVCWFLPFLFSHFLVGSHQSFLFFHCVHFGCWFDVPFSISLLSCWSFQCFSCVLFPIFLFRPERFEFDEELFLQCVRSSRRGVAGGPSGMTADHLQPILESGRDVVVLASFVTALAQGEVPPEAIGGNQDGSDHCVEQA